VGVSLSFCPSRDLFLTDQPIRQTAPLIRLSRLPKDCEPTQQSSGAGSGASEADFTPMLIAAGDLNIAASSGVFANQMLPAGYCQLPLGKQVKDRKCLKGFGCPPGIRTPIC
jgi:hypothetical protein